MKVMYVSKQVLIKKAYHIVLKWALIAKSFFLQKDHWNCDYVLGL